MCFHCPIVITKIPIPRNATLDGLHLVHTVLDHLHSDLICSPLVTHLLRTNSAIWLKEVPSSGSTAASRDVFIEVLRYGAYWTYKMDTSGAPVGLAWFTDRRLFLIPAPSQQQSHQPEIAEAGRRLKAAHCVKADMNPNLT